MIDMVDPIHTTYCRVITYTLLLIRCPTLACHCDYSAFAVFQSTCGGRSCVLHPLWLRHVLDSIKAVALHNPDHLSLAYRKFSFQHSSRSAVLERTPLSARFVHHIQEPQKHAVGFCSAATSTKFLCSSRHVLLCLCVHRYQSRCESPGCLAPTPPYRTVFPCEHAFLRFFLVKCEV